MDSLAGERIDLYRYLLIFGFSRSRTVTVNEQLFSFPLKSVARYETAVFPRGKCDPLAVDDPEVN